ncbi:MAG TPA: asparagine synthase (glutamine-hydrolyzing) [Bauldia sp.]|nr:asparagine synthase (glutamine-hydrolyzing) [Bauldia sp.]
MCGFAGFLAGSSSEPLTVLRRMGLVLHHRGPDHGAEWFDEEAQIGLAHRRLAIIDLSRAGEQPMSSANGRYVISYNGEIYNHADIRGELLQAGYSIDWRGHSDTETLLAAFEAWGVAETLKRAIGMFALALWDRHERKLTLARDRLGEKPLYYGWQTAGRYAVFLFGSELKALSCHPDFEGEIDRGALSLLMRHNYIPAPYSIYRGIKKLLPGTYLTVSLQSREAKVHSYWSAMEVARSGAMSRASWSPDEAIDELHDLLLDAVNRQMMSDVPLGAFLSGGIDSSTIVALMQAQSRRPVKTFSIGFFEGEYNEAEYAKAVGRHLGTDHTELYVTPGEAMDVIPRLPSIYDEPFADPSQIPTFLISRLARSQVTVSLSGDAGDELFGGYNRYEMTARFWDCMASVPRPLRVATARGLTSVSPATWDRLAFAARPLLPRSMRVRLPGDKVHKGAGVLASRTPAELYRGIVSLWRNPEQLVAGATEPHTVLTEPSPLLDGLTPVERMMALDTISYLPDDILVKVDRAAMAVSLETRVPFLDHRVVEFAWRLPIDLKLRNGQTKWVLRQVLYRYVPRKLVERPKMGFGVPLDEWLRGPLKSWAEELLDEGRLRREGFFEPAPIRRAWAAHLQGHSNMQYHLWVVLMFQAWLEKSRQDGWADAAMTAAA